MYIKKAKITIYSFLIKNKSCISKFITITFIYTNFKDKNCKDSAPGYLVTSSLPLIASSIIPLPVRRVTTKILYTLDIGTSC